MIIGVLSWAALLPNSHRSRGASNSAIPIFGRGGLVIADDGKNPCYNALCSPPENDSGYVPTVRP